MPKVRRSSWVFYLEVKKMTKLTPLKLARLHTGRSQWDVAKETGIPQTVVSLYERELKEPKSEHKETLAKLYGKKVGDLFERKQET
jgi:DNA-binding XRE family transcriptional regulator